MYAGATDASNATKQKQPDKYFNGDGTQKKKGIQQVCCVDYMILYECTCDIYMFVFMQPPKQPIK